MPDTVETALIATGGVVLGATIAAVASAYSARQRIAELKLTHIHQQHTNYLSNARAYTLGLYVPLSNELSRLGEQYRAFRNKVDFDSESAPRNAEIAFRAACTQYLSVVRDMFDRGASAFLTTDLEERLLAFNSFVEESLTTKESVTRLIVEYGFDLRFLPFGNQRFDFSKIVSLPSKRARLIPRGMISAGLGVIGLEYRAHTVLAAPLPSREFESRTQADLTALKALVKEVTLGAHAKHN